MDKPANIFRERVRIVMMDYGFMKIAEVTVSRLKHTDWYLIDRMEASDCISPTQREDCLF